MVDRFAETKPGGPLAPRFNFTEANVTRAPGPAPYGVNPGQQVLPQQQVASPRLPTSRPHRRLSMPVTTNVTNLAKISVDRPTIVYVLDFDGANAGGTSLGDPAITVSPGEPFLVSGTRTGAIDLGGQAVFLATPGDWWLTVIYDGGATVNTTVEALLIDCDNPEHSRSILALFDQTPSHKVAQTDRVLAPATSTVLFGAPVIGDVRTAVYVKNIGANDARVLQNQSASATAGIYLAPGGLAGSEFLFQGPTLMPRESFFAFSTAGTTLAVQLWNRRLAL